MGDNVGKKNTTAVKITKTMHCSYDAILKLNVIKHAQQTTTAV
jgi:hypothetical protein